MPSVFMSHSCVDKPFARRLSGDLGALGAQVWLDEAEIGIGDSLIDKIESAIDGVDFLAVILSPDSVASSWVREEVKQALAGQLAGREIRVLPLLLRECTLPGFLREKLYADFRDEALYDSTLTRLADTIGLPHNLRDGFVRDPFAAKFSRVSSYFARPLQWYCASCGHEHDGSYNSYACHECKTLRVLWADSATMIRCGECENWSLALAHYCEWCGHKFSSV